MKNVKELKIGVFVISVLVISFFTINYLRGKDIFDREMELTARYQNLDGLVASAPVFIKGYKAGKVIEVRYDSDTDDFKVTCSVLKDFRIPEDSKMAIYAVDIMGGKGIRIDLGTSDVMVEDGGELASCSEPALLDGLAASVTPLIDKVGIALDSLSVTVSSVNSLLSESNQASVQRTLAHLEKTMADVRSVSDAVSGRSAELESFIVSLSTLSEQLLTIAGKVDYTMGNVSSVTDSLKSSDIKGAVASLNELLESMNDPKGTVGKLLVDDSVYNSVDELLSDIDEIVKKIKENPKKYLKISVF